MSEPRKNPMTETTENPTHILVSGQLVTVPFSTLEVVEKRFGEWVGVDQKVVAFTFLPLEFVTAGEFSYSHVRVVLCMGGLLGTIDVPTLVVVNWLVSEQKEEEANDQEN